MYFLSSYTGLLPLSPRITYINQVLTVVLAAPGSYHNCLYMSSILGHYGDILVHHQQRHVWFSCQEVDHLGEFY